ncbi:MAG: amidase domain-containing protein [Sciscionella sp.]
MVTFAQLRDAKPGLWQQAADGWQAEAAHAAQCASEIRAKGKGPVDEHWQDQVGNRAGKTLAELANKFECASDEMRAAVMVLDALAESIGYAQSALYGAMEYARKLDVTIADDGSLQLAKGGAGLPIDLIIVQERLDEVLREATQADQKTAAALRKVGEAVGVTDPEKAVQVDQVAASHTQMAMLAGDIPTKADPATVSAWWKSLTAQQRYQLQLAEPTVIASLDGIPQDVKDTLRGNGKYDRMKFVQWALDHSSDTSIDAFHNNCANFVSTALHASGVQYKNNGWGTLDEDNWVEGMQTGVPAIDSHDYSHSATWSQADKLHDFLTRNGGHQVTLDQAKPGDVIFFDQNSPNPNIPQGQIHHTAVVTAVTPDGDIKYTQHTDNEQNLSLHGRELHENTVEGQQKVVAVRVNPNWY